MKRELVRHVRVGLSTVVPEVIFSVIPSLRLSSSLRNRHRHSIRVRCGGPATLATPSWNNDSIEVRQGTNVEMACTVPLTSELDTVRIFKWNKHKQRTISDNDQPKTPFVETGRYSTFYEYDSGSLVGVIRLQLTGARVGDSGRIGCRILGDDDDQNIGYVQLKVFAPVLEPEMYVTLGERATITWDVRMKELDYENDRDVDYQLQWLSGETKTPLDNYRLDSNYRIDEKILSEEHAVFHLVIQEVTRADVTTFYVVAENSFGTTESSVRLRDISEQRHAYVHVANSCATEAPRWTSLPLLLVVTSVVLLCNTLRIN
ncbi:hypothetical protein LSAT2_011093 [Lamellibrachia satsuma]|nr:hypothetical protein LSAT2_011093 [Lamellibrachia satsuma]